MYSAVIYEESYTLYDEHYERSIYDVILQHSNETFEKFQERVQDKVSSLKSRHSYYEWECFCYTFPE